MAHPVFLVDQGTVFLCSKVASLQPSNDNEMHDRRKLGRRSGSSSRHRRGQKRGKNQDQQVLNDTELPHETTSL